MKKQKKTRSVRAKKTIALQDVMDHVIEWHGTALSDYEQWAIHEVCGLGRVHGYGNMISWLNTAWALSLINEDGFDPKLAVKMVHGTPYPLPKEHK